MRVERLDDLPLLIHELEKCKIKELFEDHFPDHGLWKGASGGTVLIGWLAYILSESDHRLSHVEQWSSSLLSSLSVLLDYPGLHALDFSDDRLARLLDRVSDDNQWRKFENGLSSSLIDVYDLSSLSREKADIEGATRLPVIRADSFNAPQFRQAGELFKYGYTKQRREDQAQAKVMVAAMDPIAIPLVIEVSSGNGPDYDHYLPVFERARTVLGHSGSLFVGDSHLGSIGNRGSIHCVGDYYLCPLNLIQCNKKIKEAYLEELPEDIKELPVLKFRSAQEEYDIYYQSIEHKIEQDQIQWMERRVLVYSEPFARRRIKAFDKCLATAIEDIEKLTVISSGRKSLKTLTELNERIEKIIKKHGVKDCFIIETSERVEEYKVGKYKERPAEKRQRVHLSVQLTRNEEVIKRQQRKKGWRIYASNAPQESLSDQQLIQCYRNEYRIEHLFDYTINRDVGLLPLYLKKEQRAKAMIRILFIAMRISVMVQTSIRYQLNKEQAQLSGVYPGNKNRKTANPTTPMVLKAMKGISIVFLNTSSDQENSIIITELSEVQQNIIRLMGTQGIYERITKVSKRSDFLRET